MTRNLFWSDPENRPINEHGSKARAGNPLSPGHDKDSKKYSDWRRTVGDGCYANDVDWLEWRLGDDGRPKFVALIETTFYEDIPEWRPKLDSYCNAALSRFLRDGQYSVTMAVSEALKCPAYFVIMRYDMEVFFVCRLKDKKWRQWDEPQYRKWIKSL